MPDALTISLREQFILGPHQILVGRIVDAGINIVPGIDNMTENMFQTLMIGSIILQGDKLEKLRVSTLR